MDYERKRKSDRSEDSPPYSRLFIVCERKVTEDQFRKVFSKFGSIQDIWMPRDRNTGEPKGVAYIKFSKTSEAAAAVEEMNYKIMPDCDSTRPIKVMVAGSRSEIQSDDNDKEKYKRLFINVPKTISETTLMDHFKEYGQIDSVRIQRDRDSGECKGFAYVTFKTFSEAAYAFEECDRKYRPIFAIPRQTRPTETSYESNINTLAASAVNTRSSLMSLMNARPRGYTRVMFMCAPYLTKYHIEALFDIVPGMVQCQYFVDLMRNFGRGTVSYSNPIAAAHAVEKLNKFEYPPGIKIFVKPDNSKFDDHEKTFNTMPNVLGNLKNAIASTSTAASPDLAQLAEAIAEASKLIKMATAGVSDVNIPDSTDLNYCSVKLPPPQPLAHIDSTVAKRCFLVCKPQPPPLTVLRDVFCRFGDLINVYTLPNKTVGYARYATESAADEAMKVLHGAEICGVRIKVLEAEDEMAPKRRKYD